MVLRGTADTISALIEHHPDVPIIGVDHGRYAEVDRGMTIAQFTWLHTPNPTSTYTIDARPNLSVAFDDALPVRPSNVRLHSGEGLIDANALIEELFGTGLRLAMEAARRERSQTSATIQLTELQRHALAELQVRSASTPPHIRESVGQMALGKTVEDFRRGIPA